MHLAENDAAFDRTVATLAGERPPAWALAVAIPSRDAIVIRVTRLEAGTPNDISITLAHELAHLALWPANPPRWLDEGLAEWASGRRLTRAERNGLAELARLDTLPRLDDLAASFPRHAEAAQTAYLESLAFVEALAQDFGDASVRKLVARLARGDALPRAFELAFDAPLAAYEKGFRSDLAKSYSLLRELYERGSLLTVAALIAVIAFARYWVRRRRALRAMDEAERAPAEPES